jgi:hypothetical protein
MPPAKKRARESASLEWLVPESQVEVVMEEPGLVGSRYPARVLQVKAKGLTAPYQGWEGAGRVPRLR